MLGAIRRYTHWLHTKWPAGSVEKLPEVGEDGRTSVSGLRIVGDLTGIPLLKFSLDTGTRAVRSLLEESDFNPSGPNPAGSNSAVPDTAVPTSALPNSAGPVDLVIVGAGASGVAAAIEAKRHGVGFRLYDAAEPFSTIVNFPKGKPIYTYPTEMTPEGELEVSAGVKEDLLEELERQRQEHEIEVTKASVQRVQKSGDGFIVHLQDGGQQEAKRVILAIGRTGNYRKLGVPGEEREKVSNRLHDPADFADKDVLVVGGGDSALESAISLAEAGARVVLSYRKASFSRPKPDNIAAIEALSKQGVARGTLRLALPSTVKEITDDSVILEHGKGSQTSNEKEEARSTDGREVLPNDAVFTLIGREAPLDFFRRSGVRLIGEMSPGNWVALGAFTLAILFIYLWKGWLIGYTDAFAIGKSWGLDASTLLGALTNPTKSPSFWFTSLYTACIVGFGIARIRRRRTPYVKKQTLTLMAIQVIPLFILPEIVLPWMGANGWIPGAIEQALFPNGQYWRALGFILAWPLFLVNLASPQPMVWWLVIGLFQTFVLIPFMVWRWGKGAYCGWICSCGALAETMGDGHRHKMWHGPTANRWNMLGQVILVAGTLVTIVFMLSWHPALADTLGPLAKSAEKNYKLIVDILIGGAIGVGFYFWFSGRVWCRFACPLAALMHIYARFTRFRIFADKKKCISCNVCTSVCHQGIDIMSFANKGLPMEDPECVRCSACVQSCPTGVLQFGRLDTDGTPIYDSLAASPVLIREKAAISSLDGTGMSTDTSSFET